MIITISRERLLNEINKISRIISHKSPIPALTGLLFDVKPDKLILTGTDSTFSMRIEIEKNESNLQIEQMGRTLIKVRFVSEVIRKIDSDIVRIEVVEGNIIRINAKNFDSQLNTLNANEYPKITFDSEGKEFILKGSTLKTIINQIGFAVDENSNNSICTGIHFLFSNGKLKTTATDLFRVASKEINFPYYEETDYEVIIPIKIIQEIAKICSDQQEVILIINERNVIFKIDKTIVQSKIIDGKFPNISNVIPKIYNSNISISNRDLLNAIDRASVLSNEINNTTIKMTIDFESIQVESNSSEIGNSNEHLRDFQLEGDAIKFSFRSRYMLDAIKAFKTNIVKLSLVADDKPIIITSSEDSSLLQLVLPVATY